MNRGVEFELFGSLGCFEGNYDAGHDLVPRSKVVSLLRLQLRNLALPDLLRLFDLDPDRPPEVLHQHFRLLDLRREHLGCDHWAEGHLWTQLLSYCECDCGLASARRSSEEEGPASHFFRLDEVDNDA